MAEYTEGTENESELKFDAESLSVTLLISNVSVLALGAVFIIRACFNTSEGDFLDAGFGEKEERVELNWDIIQQRMNENDENGVEMNSL